MTRIIVYFREVNMDLPVNFTCATNSIRVSFKIFLNDLEQYMEVAGVSSLETIEQKMSDKLSIFLKIFILLYADDTVILSETAEGMQNALDIFQQYCDTWKLQVNINKTKVLVFRKRRTKQVYNFVLNGHVIEASLLNIMAIFPTLLTDWLTKPKNQYSLYIKRCVTKLFQ